MRARTRLTTTVTAALVAGGLALGGATAANAAAQQPTGSSSSSEYGSVTITGIVHQGGHDYVVGHAESKPSGVLLNAGLKGRIVSKDAAGNWKFDLTANRVKPGTEIRVKTTAPAPFATWQYKG